MHICFNPAFLTFQDSSKNPSLGALCDMGRARMVLGAAQRKMGGTKKGGMVAHPVTRYWRASSSGYSGSV